MNIKGAGTKNVIKRLYAYLIKYEHGSYTLRYYDQLISTLPIGSVNTKFTHYRVVHLDIYPVQTNTRDFDKYKEKEAIFSSPRKLAEIGHKLAEEFRK